MSQKKFQLTQNGQQVIIDDFNLLGDVAGLSDDRVFAELLHMPKYNGSTVSRGIMPDRKDLATIEGRLVRNDGATGKVRVAPFRAFVGSRTAFATSPILNHEDIRSGLALGTSTDYHTVSLAANASGNPRWDLIYAVVTVDANGPSVTRKIKDPATSVITGTSVVVYKQTTVALGVVAGTPGASPNLPAIPGDSGSNYYIPLAYVAVPNGFTGTSTVNDLRVCVVAPILTLSGKNGGGYLDWGTAHYTPGGSMFPTATMQSWGAATVTFPTELFVGSASAGGTETLLVAVQGATGAEVPPNLAIVDTRDWRDRVCKWTSIAKGVTVAPQFGWGGDMTDGGGREFPTAGNTGAGTDFVNTGLTQTFRQPTPSLGDSSPIELARAVIDFGTSRWVSLMCTPSTGQLYVSYNGTFNGRALFWLEFSPRMEYRTA